MMTPEQILALEGPALTKLAFELGLAPSNVFAVELAPSDAEARPGAIPFFQRQMYTKQGELRDHLIPWLPHEDLAQAEALFRSLRTQQWNTTNSYSAHTQQGIVTLAYDPPDRPYTYYRPGDLTVCHYGGEEEDTEALALLRVSVLALASTV